MNKYLVSSLLMLILLLQSMNHFSIPLSDGLEDATEDIIFEGDGSFSGSVYVGSGSGTESDPFIVSDYNMEGRNVQIKNTTSFVIVRNMTFSDSSRWAVFLYRSDNVIIENITSIGRSAFLYSYDCEGIVITDCNASEMKFSSYTVQVIDGTDITVQDSIFTKDSISGAGPFIFNNAGSGHVLKRNHFNGVAYHDLRMHDNGEISNNTFIDSKVVIDGGRDGSVINDNDFEHSSEDALAISNSYRLFILRNNFTAPNGDGIAFTDIAYTTNTDPQIIAYNRFETCVRGISTQTGWQTRLTRNEIHHNYFGNCSGYAIELNNAYVCSLWRNTFYHNAGTDNSTAGSQVQENTWPQSVWKNKWTVNGEGNFWANHRTPDLNNDGIVDVNYSLTTNGLDTAPCTNPYFDTVRPVARLLYPVKEYSGRSYIKIRWESYDDLSGLDKVLVKVDELGSWIDVTGQPYHSVFLKKGSHDVTIKSFDRAGLYNISTNSFLINNTKPVLKLDHPIDGGYYSQSLQTIQWSLQEYFDPVNLTLSIDGERIYLPTDTRLLTRSLDEGTHTIEVSVTDSYGLVQTVSVSVTIDLTAPEIVMISPTPGSVLSNPFISFNYDVTDNYGIQSLEVNLNDGSWLDKTGVYSFNELLDQGPNKLYIKATDLAGIVTNLSVAFVIGGDTGINISQPLNGTVTKDSSVDLIWDYEGDFTWNRSLLRIGKAGIFEDIMGSKNWKVELPSDGNYEITLRLEDRFGNYIQESIFVRRDLRPPNIGFFNPRNDDYLNSGSIRIEWLGNDASTLPIVKYELRIDDGQWIDMGQLTFYEAQLEDGEHQATVKGWDLAGNEGERTIEFFIDTKAPVVTFLSPSDGELIKDPSTDFRWDIQESGELVNVTLVIDGTITYNVTSLTSGVKRAALGLDGYHTAVLIAVDRAGNQANDTVDIFVDTASPVLKWDPIPRGYSNKPWYNISWSIQEKWGISNITLNINDDEIHMDPGSTYYNTSLAEGKYKFSLKVTDLVGWVVELIKLEENVLTVDMTPPTLQIDETQTEIIGRKLTLVWNTGDKLSEVDAIYLALDGGPFDNIGVRDSFTFEDLDPGSYNLTLLSVDKAGNEATESWQFVIGNEGNGGEGTEEGSVPIFAWIAIGIVGILLVFIVIGVVINRRKSRERQGLSKVEKPKRISLGPQATPPPSAIPMSDMPSASELPPTAVPIVEETDHGSGYIRPKREEKKRPKEITQEEEQVDPAPVPEEEIQDTTKEEDISEQIPFEGQEEEKRDEAPMVDLPDDIMEEPPSTSTSFMEPPEPEQDVPSMTDDDRNDGELSEVPSWDEDESVEEWDQDDDPVEYEDFEDIDEFDDIEEMDDWEE